jgi:hypothetical protein
MRGRGSLGAEVFTRLDEPRPKNCSQARLTVTRAVSGFAGLTSQRASPRRLGISSSRHRRQNGWCRSEHALARRQERAALAKRRRWSLVRLTFSHDERGDDAKIGELFLDRVDAVAHRRELRGLSAVLLVSSFV